MSVVLITYNRQALLRETVESILNQTFSNFELIVVDNVSEDGTESYVKSLDDPRVRYIRHSNGGVIAINRNAGISAARGEYIAFCDDDDLWLPGKLQRQLEAMKERPDAGLCFTDGIAFKNDEVVVPSLITGKKRLFLPTFYGLLLENYIPCCSVMARRAVFAKAGMMDESPEINAVHDWEMWLRIAYGFPLIFVDEPLVKYRLHQNITSSPSRTALHNISVIRKVSHKLKLNLLPAWMSLGYQYLKYCWFVLNGR